jgi:hypothetical protein
MRFWKDSDEEDYRGGMDRKVKNINAVWEEVAALVLPAKRIVDALQVH